jgi:hypothetical protein
MLLNGAIDLDQYYVDFKVDILNKKDTTLDIKGCVAFAVKNLGNVPLRIDNTISIGIGECNSRTFPNYLFLRYGVNKPIAWDLDDISNPDARAEFTRVYLIKKNVSPEVSNERPS